MTADPRAPRTTTPTVEARYETLRAAALGAPLPCESRGGLALFLRRGMWAWCRALAREDTPPEPTGPPSPRTTARPPHHAVVQSLAALVLNTAPRRTP